MLKVREIYPDAKMFLDHGAFFVGLQMKYGRLILGWGATVDEAAAAAAANV